MTHNREFKIVFQPKYKNLFHSRRFGVGAKSLHKYIGHKNATTVFVKMLKCKDDKLRLKFRKHGIVDIYCK